MCAAGVMSVQALVHVSSSPGPGPGLQTALHRAAMVGNSDTVAALIQGGCAMDLQDRVSSGHYTCQTYATGKVIYYDKVILVME